MTEDLIMGADLGVFAFFLLIAAVIAVYAIRLGITPMPTSRKVRARMFDLLPPDLQGTIYELGAGWGTLAIPLAKRFPACRVVGYELSPLPWLFSRVHRFVSGPKNVALRKADFFRADLKDAVLVVCYLNPEVMAKLKTKFEAELKPGTLVLCHYFAVRGWQPVDEDYVEDIHRTPVYLYRMR